MGAEVVEGCDLRVVGGRVQVKRVRVCSVALLIVNLMPLIVALIVDEIPDRLGLLRRGGCSVIHISFQRLDLGFQLLDVGAEPLALLSQGGF